MTEEDDDVAAERTRINASPVSALCQKDSLLLVNLSKKYGSFLAVDRVCVGIPDEECFGLLGQNGAGMSSIFKMLTGTTFVAAGSAYLRGFDVRTKISKVINRLG